MRRSLILIRSLPTIEPSPDFQARLNARLRALPPAGAGVVSQPPIRSFTAIAASVVLVAYLAAELLMRSGPGAIQMPPVVASVPEIQGGNSQVATPALVATVPTGMSVWPALMVASQSVHFVAAELATER